MELEIVNRIRMNKFLDTLDIENKEEDMKEFVEEFYDILQMLREYGTKEEWIEVIESRV